MKLTIDTEIRTVSEPNQRGHWTRHAARHRDQRFAAWRHRDQRFAAWAELRVQQPPGGWPRPALVTLTRIARRSLDPDNLADALGVDDGDPNLVRWIYRQEIDVVVGGGVRIEIEEAPSLTPAQSAPGTAATARPSPGTATP